MDGKVERVRPQDIRNTALLTVEGELDDISGSGQTRAAQELCASIPKNDRRHLEVEGAGHYGIFSGRRWREVVYPQVVAFIREHARPQTAKSAPAAKALTAAKAPTRAASKPAAKSSKPAAKSKTKTGNKTSTKSGVKTQWVKAKA